MWHSFVMLLWYTFYLNEIFKSGKWGVTHSIKHSPQRAQSGLVNQAELQRSLFWIGAASKEYSSREGESLVEERASGAEADAFRVQDSDWSSTGRSKNQRGKAA